MRKKNYNSFFYSYSSLEKRKKKLVIRYQNKTQFNSQPFLLDLQQLVELEQLLIDVDRGA